MIIVWLVAFLVFLVVEMLTAGLASIWFAIGALAAFICALIAPDLIWLQVVWFIVVSAVTLIATRPLAKKYLNSSRNQTNADRIIGMVGAVTERIDNFGGTGCVYIGGKTWTARSENGQPIESGTLVTGIRIEGVTLFVLPAPKEDFYKKEGGDE